jgi:RND family efflux transporter MFP subunit
VEEGMQGFIRQVNRFWLVIAIITAFLIISAAGYLGYRASQAEVTQALPVPQTIPVERGEVLLSVTAPGQLTNMGQASVLSAVNGSIEQVMVQSGGIVSKGQILAKIGDRTNFEVAISNAKADLVQAQAAVDAINPQAIISQAHLDLLNAQKDYENAQKKRLSLQYGRASQATLDLARSNYILAQTSLDQTKETFNNDLARSDTDPVRAQAVSQIAAVTQQRDKALANLNWLLGKPDAIEIGQAEAQVQLTREKVNSAQAKYDHMQNGDIPERDQTEANLTKAQTALTQAKENLDNLDIRAPFAGVIIDINARIGQNVSNGMELFKIVDPHQLEVSATIVEENLQFVKIGQEAQLFFDALPDINVSGRLARIVPQRTNDGRVLYPIYISLDQVSDRLVSGMTVDATITIEKKEAVLRLPRALVHARSDGTADLSVWNGLQVEKRSIKVGLRGDSYDEIVSGLQAGDQVVSK